jgi:cellulose synthase/poly-beta-1,6-N-acetylglucosamine synthase-like glycosyltransferase
MNLLAEVFDMAFTVYGLMTASASLALLLYKPRRTGVKAKNLAFVIPTVAKPSVMPSLMEVLANLAARFPWAPVHVVVDEPADEAVVSEIGRYAHVVKVPRDFPGKPCKGRAVEYFRLMYARPDMWYVILDDDSYPLDDKFLEELPTFDSRYAAANGILVPRPGRSKLAYILDHIRLWDDLTFFRLSTGLLGRPIFGMHGELLIIRGDVFAQVPFPTDSLVEDFVYAQELYKRGYKTWQVSTRVSIKSPNSILDFLKQRARWAKGIWRELPRAHPATVAAVASRKVFGFMVSMLLAPVWALLHMFNVFGLIGGMYYISAYAKGLFSSRAWWAAPLLPIMGIFEPLHIVYLYKIKTFVVIDKT